MRLPVQLKALAAIAALVACAHASPTQPESPAGDIAELWQDPIDLAARDLIGGPGGAALSPKAETPFQFVAFKTGGTNPGYDVRDPAGRLWSVKLGVEAQSEVTTSRILWAMGFHQPAIYYLPQFTLTGADAGSKMQARFRTDLDQWLPGGQWSWYENPFLDMLPFRGLVVAQLLLNNWDMKTTNNRIYDAVDATVMPRRQFMVRDVGSSLGMARQFFLFNLIGTRGRQGSKNDLAGFEQQGFIKRVTGQKVEFDYRGMNQALVDTVTVADVIWTSELFARIPDGQWQAAFRAGGYGAADADRYIRKIKQKIGQGLALKTSATN